MPDAKFDSGAFAIFGEMAIQNFLPKKGTNSTGGKARVKFYHR